MTTTHDVMLAVIPSRKLLRDAYIDIHGYDVTLLKNSLGEDRVDIFGDVISNAAFTEHPIKLVVNLAKLQRLMLNHVNKTTESVMTPIKAWCKLDLDIVAGDRIRLPQTLSGTTEVKELQVVEVLTQAHSAAISKVVSLEPARS